MTVIDGIGLRNDQKKKGNLENMIFQDNDGGNYISSLSLNEISGETVLTIKNILWLFCPLSFPWLMLDPYYGY